MSYSKQQFVERALEKLGIASYDFDLSPDELQAACDELDAMVADWAGNGIRIGWPLALNPDNSSLTTDTGVPSQCNLGIIANLAIWLAPSYGKQVPAELAKLASKGMRTILSLSVKSNTREMQFQPNLPAGAGNRWRGPLRPFVVPPKDQNLPPPEQDLTFS